MNSDWAILEPVDRDHRPTPPGELSHTVLLTNLANSVQPIVRYDLGDRVRAATSRCACGSPLPAIQVEGRCDDVVACTARDGTIVRLVPLALTTVVEEAADVHRFQIVQRAADCLVLRLGAADRARAAAPALRALRAHLDRHGLRNVTSCSTTASRGSTPRDGKLRGVVALPRR